MKEMTLDDIKSCSLGVLDFIDTVCRENNLTYFLCAGTLLGAVRHKGFIPWDDDIDIMMPRDDYERLFEVWPQDSRYHALYYKNTPNLPYAYGKTIDTKTIKIEPIRTKNLNLGVDVDIFPIDGLPNDVEEAKAFYNRIEKMQKRLALQLANFGRGSSLPRTIARNVRLALLRVCDLLGFTSIYKVTKRFDRLAQSYTGNTREYCGITAISHYGIKEMNPTSNYDKVVYVKFEGKDYPAPIGYADYLSRLYGENYMQLPPLEKRKTHHHYEAYWKE